VEIEGFGARLGLKAGVGVPVDSSVGGGCWGAGCWSAWVLPCWSAWVMGPFQKR